MRRVGTTDRYREVAFSLVTNPGTGGPPQLPLAAFLVPNRLLKCPCPLRGFVVPHSHLFRFGGGEGRWTLGAGADGGRAFTPEEVLYTLRTA
jgi:hypothetical protein